MKHKDNGMTSSDNLEDGMTQRKDILETPDEILSPWEQQFKETCLKPLDAGNTERIYIEAYSCYRELGGKKEYNEFVVAWDILVKE